MKKIIKFLLFVVVTLFLFPNFIFAQENLNTNKILYESIGKYSFKVAGAHNIEVQASTSQDLFNKSVFNADRVTTFNNSVQVYDITDLPTTDLSSVPFASRKFVKDKTGITTFDNNTNITNVSGSKLSLDGKVKKAFLFVKADLNNLTTGTANNVVTIVTPKNRIITLPNDMVEASLAINPQTVNTGISYTIPASYLYQGIYDVTDIVKTDGAGWYYVSINGMTLTGQYTSEYSVWGMIVIDEASNYPISYAKIKFDRTWTNSNETTTPVEYTLDSKVAFEKQENSKIGLSMIAIDAEPSKNYYANNFYLITGTNKIDLKTLKDSNNNYLFPTRSDNYSFLYSVCDTTRKTSYKNCYEMDIFNGEIPTSNISETNLLKFEASSSNGQYGIPIMGIRVEIKSPELEVPSKIEKTDDGKILSAVTLNNISLYNSCSTILTIPIDSNLKNITDITLSDPNIANYKLENNKIVVTFSGTFKTNATFKITYKAERTTNAEVKLNLDPIVTYYPSNGETCLEDITNDKTLELTATSHSELVIPKIDVVEVPNTGVSITEMIIIGVVVIAIGAGLILFINKKKNND